MKKTLLLFSVFLLLSSFIAMYSGRHVVPTNEVSDPEDVTLSNTDSYGEKAEDSIINAQGVLTEVLPDNDAAVRFGVNQTDGNGDRDGYWCEEKNGQRYYSFYKNGKRNGIFRHYEKSGKQWHMLAVGVCKDDEPVGPWLYFDENGIKNIKNGNETITDIAINQTDSLGNKIGYWCVERGNQIYVSYHISNNEGYALLLNYEKISNQWVLRDVHYGIELKQFFHENGRIAIIANNISTNRRFIKKMYKKHGYFYPEEMMQCYLLEYSDDGIEIGEGWCVYGESIEYDMDKVGDWIYYNSDGTKTIKYY